MQLIASRATSNEIAPFRLLFLQEFNSQFICDSFHEREWADPYILRVDNVTIGYGSLCGGDAGRDVIFEFYIIPSFRHLSHPIFTELVRTSAAKYIECQSNDLLLTSMLYEFAKNINAGVILFEDHTVTRHRVPEVVFRQRQETDVLFEHKVEPEGHFILERNGEIVATGGILGHYNMPFADLFMEVREDWHLRGFGTFLVQEMKRVCYENNRVPAARCGIQSLDSKATLLKAGFRVCGYEIKGEIK